MTFNRRLFLLSAVAAAFSARSLADAGNPFGLPAGEIGQQNDLSNVIKPYLAVGPYEGDRHRVYMFLSYECPYCEQTWYGLGQWGSTLPEPFRFVYVPVYTGNKRSDAAATGYYVVRDLAPSRIGEYNRLAFDTARRAKTADDYIGVLRRMGFGREAVKASLAKQQTRDRIARAMMLVRNYRITATPFFAVGGRYTTHAGFTNGNYQMLVQLLNGLVSDVVQGK